MARETDVYILNYVMCRKLKYESVSYHILAVSFFEAIDLGQRWIKQCNKDTGCHWRLDSVTHGDEIRKIKM